MIAKGLRLSGHQSRMTTVALLAEADLVVGMTTAHVRQAVACLPSVWPRAFTLKELVRRGDVVGARHPDQTLSDWLTVAHSGRLSGDLERDDPGEDIDDPMGRPDRVYTETASELDSLLVKMVESLGLTMQSEERRLFSPRKGKEDAMTELELVSGAEIGRRLGVSRERVRQWAHHPKLGFPEPVSRNGRLVTWEWAPVQSWAEEYRNNKKPAHRR